MDIEESGSEEGAFQVDCPGPLGCAARGSEAGFDPAVGNQQRAASRLGGFGVEKHTAVEPESGHGLASLPTAGWPAGTGSKVW